MQVLFEKSGDIGGVWQGSNYAGYGAQVKREQHLRYVSYLVPMGPVFIFIFSDGESLQNSQYSHDMFIMHSKRMEGIYIYTQS